MGLFIIDHSGLGPESHFDAETSSELQISEKYLSAMRHLKILNFIRNQVSP